MISLKHVAYNLEASKGGTFTKKMQVTFLRCHCLKQLSEKKLNFISYHKPLGGSRCNTRNSTDALDKAEEVRKLTEETQEH